MRLRWNILIGVLIFLTGSPASAYVGPGAGLSAIGSFIGFMAAILISLGVILFWPLRIAYRKLRGRKSQVSERKGIL